MSFVAIPPLRKRERVPWKSITHVRIADGKRPDTGRALERWQRLRGLADRDGVIELERVMSAIEPVRNKRRGREASIRDDLRYWANAEDHGETSLDKGWLELGSLNRSGE